MRQPLISVCIVSYNHQAYITDCLTSVLTQYGAFRLEVLLGDDASTDDTVMIVRNIIDQYHGQADIRLFAHEQNLGPSQNYQFLITRAEGDYIAHLDGDDFWLPGKLQTQLQFLETHPDCPACYTNTVVMQDDKSHWGFFNTIQPQHICTEELIRKGNLLNHSSLLYRSQHKPTILDFPDNFIDYRIHLALSRQGTLGYINQILVSYRLNSSTSMIRLMREKFILLYVDALLSMQPEMPQTLIGAGLELFLKQILFTLWWQGKRDFIKTLVAHYQQACPYFSQKLAYRLLLQSFFLEINNALHRRIRGCELRFLQRNQYQNT